MLDKMFNPQSIALIGVTPNERKLGSRLLRFLLDYKYQGKILPVNPNYEEIWGIKCYPQISDLPDDTDVVLVTLPAESVEGILKECAAKGIKNVVVYSSGFREVGEAGKELQERITRFANENNISLLGPNCHGLVNLVDSIPMSFNTALDQGQILAGNIGFVSQSGALATYILALAKEQDIGFSYWVTTGNEANIDFCDCISYLLDEPRTEVICVYAEEIRDGNKFIECAKKAFQLGKPIVLLKVGRSASGSEAASSHTGAVTGSDEAYEAVFKRYGIIRAMNIQELLDYTVALAAGRYPESNNVAIVTISGGGGIIMADDCEDNGLAVPLLSDKTRDKLKTVVPSFGSTKNPVDVTAQLITQPEILKDTLVYLTEDPTIDIITIFLGLQRKTGDILARDIVDVAKSSNKLITVAWMSPPDSAVKIMTEASIPVFTDATRCINAIKTTVQYSQFRKDTQLLSAPEPSPVSGDVIAGNREKMSGYKESGRKSLSEQEGKQLIEQYGIRIPRMKVAKTLAEAKQIASEIGFPLVLKINSPDVLHKSDIGAVITDVKDLNQVENAFDKIIQAVKAHYPNARINGIIMEEMIPKGIEVILGAKKEKPFGPIIAFGLGGIYTELLRDVAHSTAPLTLEQARKLIDSIKSSKLFYGYRGSAPADADALADMLVRVFASGF